MALQKQVIPVVFGTGVDTKEDPKENLEGKLQVLQNGRFVTPKRIQKRNGYTAITNSVLGGATITNGINITAYNKELVVTDGNLLYSYVEQQPGFSQKGAFVSLGLNATSVVRNNSQQTSQDSCYHSSGLQLFAWEDSTGGMRYSVVDNLTGAFIIPNLLLSSTASQPKCITIGNNLVLMYFDSSVPAYRFVAINSATPTTRTSPANIATNVVATSVIYDAALIGTQIVFGYNSSTALTLTTISAALAVGSQTAITGEVASGALNVFGDSSNNAWVSYYNGTAVKTLIRSSTLASVLAPTVVETVASVRNIAGAILTGTTANILYEINNTSIANYNEYIRINTITLAGSVGLATVLIRSVGLASKIFAAYGNTYFLATYDSPLQPSYFVISTAGFIVGKVSPQEGGGLTKKSILPEVNLISTNIYQISYLQRDTVQVDNGMVVSNTGVMQSNLTFGQPSTCVNIGNNLLLSGALVTEYDGTNVVEQGFNYFPETPTVIYAPVGGGLAIGNQYQYVTTYEWVDNQGQVNRSAASTAVTANLVGNESTFQFFAHSISGSPYLKNPITGGSNPIFPGYVGYVGMEVTGSSIPAGTYITAIDNTNGWTMSANASATGLVTSPQIVPQIFLTASSSPPNPSTGTNIFYVNPVISFAVFGSTNGSTTITVFDPSQLAVGMSLNPGGGGGGQVITAISGNVVTLGGSVVSEGYCSFAVTLTWNGTTTSGQQTIGGIPANIISQLYEGQTISSSAFSGNVQIIAIGTTNITVSNTATSTGTNDTFAWFGPNAYLRVGNQFTSGTGLLANANIVSMTYQSVTVDQNFTAEPTGNYIINNVIMGVLSIPTLRVTAKQNVRCVLYRTQANGTIFFRASPLTNPFYSNPTVDYIQGGDHYADSYITGNDQLYTTGGVVDNIGVPASNILFVDQNRLIAIPSEDPATWWFSQEIVPGDPVEFSDEFVSNVDQRGGVITSGYQLDDKMILFKSNIISYVAGEGPAPSGVNNDFTNPLLISSDAGCINQASIVIMPMGIMFQSSKGIYLLDRSLGLEYIGADAEALANSAAVTSAQLVTNTNEVRFTMSSGIILTYDYYVKQWASDTNLSGVGSCLWQGNFVFLQSNGIAQQESVGVYNDNGNFIPLSLTTSWLSFNQLQGFQRVYKMNILGDYYSPHTLQVQLQSNFRANTIDQTSMIPVLTNPGSGNYQYRVFLLNQKTESIQVMLTELQSGPPYDQGLDLSGITFEVGAKDGVLKLPASRSFG